MCVYVSVCACVSSTPLNNLCLSTMGFCFLRSTEIVKAPNTTCLLFREHDTWVHVFSCTVGWFDFFSLLLSYLFFNSVHLLMYFSLHMIFFFWMLWCDQHIQISALFLCNLQTISYFLLHKIISRCYVATKANNIFFICLYKLLPSFGQTKKKLTNFSTHKSSLDWRKHKLYYHIKLMTIPFICDHAWA